MKGFIHSRAASDRPERQAPGFTLAAVLVVMAALLLLSVGVLAVVGIERKTARSYVDAKRAEWVALAGMEEVRGLLKEETDNDEYLVISKPGEVTADDSARDALDYLWLARGQGGGENVSFRVVPMFSAAQKEQTISDLTGLPEPTGTVGDDPLSVRTRPWAAEAKLAWVPVLNEDDRMIGRYAWWVEDLQARLDGSRVVTGDREVEYPETGPGISRRDENIDGYGPEVAAYTLDPEAADDEDKSDLDDKLEDGRELMISPDSVLAATGVEPPLARENNGKLSDPFSDELERNVNPGVESYFEQPLVPHAAGIDEVAAGMPKLDLNELLDGSRESAISEFAEQVRRALPDFDSRKGGFPEDYVETLAAGAFDYADEDSASSLQPGSYRGLDAFPVVSEHLVRYRWESIVTEEGRKYVVISGSAYAELWNMSDQPVQGDVRLTYETNYGFPLGAVPDLNLGSDDMLASLDPSSVELVEEDGYRWFPPQRVSLEPNQYQLLSFGPVIYKIDAGPESVWVPSPIVLSGENDGEAGYRMEWNGQRVDQSRANVKHPDMTIGYPADLISRPRQGVWATIPGHSYSRGSFDYVNNMGDPRMAYYIQLAQDPNDYPDNYSPNRRTIRWGNVYQGDGSTKPKVYGRVMPSEWPDGGHNTYYGSIPPAVMAGRGSSRGDERISPDDPQFFRNLPDVEPNKAPMRIANSGRFVSATELGRIYDPLMWAPTYERASETNQIRSGLMPGSQVQWPLVAEVAPTSTEYGGGNSLRIGRPEHPKFQKPGLHAALLLDLFYATPEQDAEVPEGLVRVDGLVNLNTAPRDVLRALAAGMLKQDPVLLRRLSNSHNPNNLMAPPVSPIERGTPRIDKAADVIADAIIRSRPFASAADLAMTEDANEEPVFGNAELYDLGNKLEWNDSAAEEVFERVYNSSTLRSRNFRVWVVGQALAPSDPDDTTPVVLSEVRKVFTVFADPGERDPSGTIDSTNYRPIVGHENDF